jgi:hypothetical protein
MGRSTPQRDGYKLRTKHKLCVTSVSLDGACGQQCPASRLSHICLCVSMLWGMHPSGEPPPLRQARGPLEQKTTVTLRPEPPLRSRASQPTVEAASGKMPEPPLRSRASQPIVKAPKKLAATRNCTFRGVTPAAKESAMKNTRRATAMKKKKKVRVQKSNEEGSKDQENKLQEGCE